VPPKPFISEEQYLEIERITDRKSEYFQGEMFPMEATIEHVMINGNLFVILSQSLPRSGHQS
jgi:hypothetical protein